jgi:hypothetical protein
VWHVAALHIFHVPSSESLLASLRSLASRLSLTVKLFYKTSDGGAWDEVLILCEATAAHIDQFVESLRALDLFDSVSTVLRQWSYALEPVPAERAQWTHVEWTRMAEEEMHGFEGAAAADAPAAESAPPRQLGPAGIRGCAFSEWTQLVKRLDKLELGCAWDDVALAAKLHTLQRERTDSQGEEAGAVARKRGRCDAPRTAAHAAAAAGVADEFRTLDLVENARHICERRRASATRSLQASDFL